MHDATILVAGASGQHAGVVYEAAMLRGIDVRGFAVLGGGEPSSVLGCNSLGKLEDIAVAAIRQGNKFVPAVGSNVLRNVIYNYLYKLGASFRNIVHPNAIVSPSAIIEDGSVILAGAIVGTGAMIGRCAIINHGASVDHDCVLGEFVNLSPGARLAGSVRLGSRVAVGLNASIIQGCHLEDDVVVGAGAVVTRDIACGVTVVGVPARPIPSAHKRK